jgi:hypothetical protein
VIGGDLCGQQRNAARLQCQKWAASLTNGRFGLSVLPTREASGKQRMEQQDQQRIVGRPFPKGTSGNARGRESAASFAARIEAKARELAIELGGYDTVSEIDRVLLRTAAGLLLRRPKNSEDTVRIGNGVLRALSTLQRRHGRRPGRQGRALPMRERLAAEHGG